MTLRSRLDIKPYRIHYLGQRDTQFVLRRTDRDIAAQLKAMGLPGNRIPPVAVSPWCRLGLMLAALVTILLLSAYFVLIPLTGWAVYWLTSTYGVHSGAASGLHALGVSSAILFCGCLMILSLLKPLVARPARATEPYVLDPDEEPLIYAFVRELASNVGAPEPSRIAIDCNVNCCCVFAGGISGFFRPGFDLVVGLPLVAGLRLDRMAGVLVHELGHAALTTNIRSNRLIWSVNAWFSRVVFEPDEFDQQILTRLETADRGRRFVLHLAQVLVQPARGLLWVLMVAACAASCVVLRRMELEADRYQIQVAGTEAFIAAVLEINLLAVASQRALVELSRMKRGGRLVDNYPGFVVSLRGRYSAGFAGRLLAGLEQGKTGMFSAHPADCDRMAFARTENCQGRVTAALPASVLFARHDALCRAVTLEFYKQEFGLSEESCELVICQSVLERMEIAP
jgi:Zn-dependent protease with chaperone function